MSLIKLDELTWPKLEALIKGGTKNLLLPVGTLEAHSRHAPIGTDNFCAEDIACRLGEILGWPVAPTVNYGITSGLIAYPGGVRISKDLYGKFIREILENFLEMGFKRIVIINGHGGNTETISGIIKELITRDRGNRHLILVDWWWLGSDALKETYGRPGGHAALDETACVVAFRPELIDESALKPEEYTRFTQGIVSMPYSSAMLVYDEGDATPDFDRDKATGYMNMVIERIKDILLREVELFESSFGPKKEDK
jgi:creatinine amidohydrolase